MDGGRISCRCSLEGKRQEMCMVKLCKIVQVLNCLVLVFVFSKTSGNHHFSVLGGTRSNGKSSCQGLGEFKERAWFERMVVAIPPTERDLEHNGVWNDADAGTESVRRADDARIGDILELDLKEIVGTTHCSLWLLIRQGQEKGWRKRCVQRTVIRYLGGAKVAKLPLRSQSEESVVISALHRKGVVRGDIKLSNILLTQNKLVLCNFRTSAFVEEVVTQAPFPPR
jgi:hypothetical protein